MNVFSEKLTTGIVPQTGQKVRRQKDGRVRVKK